MLCTAHTLKRAAKMRAARVPRVAGESSRAAWTLRQEQAGLSSRALTVAGRCHTDASGYEGPWTNAPTTFSNDYYTKMLELTWTVGPPPPPPPRG